MNISAVFIRRPVMTILVTAAAVVFGWLAYRQLPVSDLPSVDFPTIQISAGLPGASAETMAASVATPLEREFSTIAGVDSMTSSSLQSSTSITLQFTLDRDIDAAAQDVQSAIARTLRRLPADMPSPPSYRKVNPADSPILFMSVTSPTLPLYKLNEYADTLIGQRLSMVPGVAQVSVNGAQKYAVRIRLDPQRLALRGIGLDEVARAVQQFNVKLPVGIISGPKQALTIESTGQLMSADEFARTIVAYRNGYPVLLSEIATVVDSVEDERTGAWFKSEDGSTARAIVISVQRQPGANTVEVAKAVKAILPTLLAQIPQSVRIETLYDRSLSIEESVHDVQFTLVLTIALVVLVIFLFLRNIRATLIPSLAIPVSIIVTFAIMHLLNFSLDNLSLMALTLCTGFVVDDAIVVLENIVRHMEMGKSRLRAAYDGSKQIIFTILSMTISLVAVFIPVLLMPGLVGRLLNEFAITIAVAILVSGVVSLTLTPMMCSRMLDPDEGRHDRKRGFFYRLIESAFNSSVRFYGWTLRSALRWKSLTLVGSLAILAATAWMFVTIPKGFLPSEDQNRVLISTEAAEGTSFDQMVQYQAAVAAIVAEQPYVKAFQSSIGARGGQSTGTNAGLLVVRLTDRSTRPHAEAIVQDLRRKLAVVPGVNSFPQIPPTIRIGGQLTKSLYQFTLQSTDTEALYRFAPLLTEKIKVIPGIQDATTDLLLRNPQLRIEIDRDKAAAVGVTPEQIELALSSAFGTREISTIYAPTNDYAVILELEPQYQADPAWLDTLYVRSSNGALVQLTSVAHVSRGFGPASVNHSGQFPSITISFDLAPGYSLGPAVDAVNKVAAQILPATITTSFQGTAQAFESSLVGLGVLLVMAILVTYVILGVLYESFVHPITILTALPFAGFGALATLMLFKVEVTLYAFVGIILLIGLVKKNGIMMVDFALEQRRSGMTPFDAIHSACIARFRPIMMTTLAALMGTLPIALGLGAGAEARRPLGLAVVGGLLFSQLVTLYATPVFYLYFDAIQRFIERRLGHSGDPGQHHENGTAAPSPIPQRDASEPARIRLQPAGPIV